MSIHSSLRVSTGAGSLRNILKRYERVRYLMTHSLWTEGQSVFGLPKIKQIKIKARKAAPKEEKAEAAASTTEAAPASASTGSAK